MKFLLEFVSCCGAGGGDSSEKNPPEAKGRCSEETRSLMAQRTLQTVRLGSRRKRGRVGSASVSTGVGMGEWKPTLSSISEDNVVMKEERRERVVKRKGGGGSRRLASIPNYNEDYRRNNQFSVIPTFSATPFMI